MIKDYCNNKEDQDVPVLCTLQGISNLQRL